MIDGQSDERYSDERYSEPVSASVQQGHCSGDDAIGSPRPRPIQAPQNEGDVDEVLDADQALGFTSGCLCNENSDEIAVVSGSGVLSANISSGNSPKPIRRASLTFELKKRGCWDGAGNLMRPFFRRLGLHVARRPVTAILLTFAFSMLCSLGLLRLERAQGYRIWQDSSTTAYQQFEWISDVWPDEYVQSSVIFIQDKPDADILTGHCLDEVAGLRDSLLSKFPASLCKSADGVCQKSLLHYLEVSGVALSDAKAFLNQSQSKNGGTLPFHLASVVGGVCCGSALSAATSLRMTFHTLPKGDAETESFEEDFLEICQSWTSSSTSCSHLRAHCLSSSSYETEQKRSMASDTNLMMVAILIMIAYMAAALGRACNCVDSKALLGTSVVASVGFAFAISFGIGSMVGIKFSQMSLLAIFILLGVGIDDAFVINDAFERCRFTDAIDLRLAAALEEVGPSVFLTSATDFVAFLVGMFFPVEAIAFFCMTAAIAIFTIFLMQTTWFAALLVLNARRQQSMRCDMCPCLPAGKLLTSSTIDSSTPNSQATQAADRHVRLPWLEKVFRPIPMVLVVLFFAGLVVASIWLATNEMQKGATSSDYLPAGSYVSEYWTVERKYFGARHAVMIVAKQLNLASVEELDAHQEALKQVSELDIAIQPPEPTWLDAFISWRNLSKGSDGSLLHEFVASSYGSPYSADLVSKGGADSVSARAAIWVRLHPPEEKSVQVKATKRIRQAYDQSHMRERIDGFVWAGFFIGADAYENLDHLLVTSMSIAVAAIGLVCFVLLPPLVASMTLLSIAFANIDIMGMLCLWQVSMGTAMMANLVMALGFSVDYSAHIADAFCVRVKRRESEDLVDPAIPMARALRTVGFSVMHAGVSTLLAVVVLAFSSTRGFQDLFRCFLLMVTLGLLHSMVLLPVLLVSFERFMHFCRHREKT